VRTDALGHRTPSDASEELKESAPKEQKPTEECDTFDELDRSLRRSKMDKKKRAKRMK